MESVNNTILLKWHHFLHQEEESWLEMLLTNIHIVAGQK